MQIPNCDKAVIDLRKLTEYSLNPSARDGGNKAYLFEKLLGLTKDDARFLRAELLKIVCNDDAVISKENNYGVYYVIEFVLRRNEAQVLIRSVWIIRTGDDIPRLTTCYILPGKRVNND